MEENLPIDIHYNKLSEWLISRRHCQQNWSEMILNVRQQINDAIQDMPPLVEITTLLQGTYINYFNCKEIVEILKRTEGSSKTLFGSYSSKRLQDWISILKNYEKDNLYLAEAGQLLTRSVNFEIPSLKRQINKASQSHKDYCKKEIDYQRNSLELKEKYKKSCKELGIEGKKIKKEIKLLVLENLPKFYDNVITEVKDLNKEIHFYANYSHFISSGIRDQSKCIKMLKHLLENGNTSVFQWKFQKLPKTIIKDELDFGEDEEKEEGNNQEIDWGELSLEPGNNEEVDNSAEIDWGIEDVSEEKKNKIEEEEDHLKKAGKENDELIAKGADACSILEFIKTRELVLDDLYELESFLVQRLQNIKEENYSNFLTCFLFQSASSSLQVDEGQLEKMLSRVQSTISGFLQPKIKELFLICSYPKHVNKMASKLKKLLEDSDKMASQSKLMVARQQEVQQEVENLTPKLEIMREKTKLLKKQIENEISKKYKSRKVNIMGEVNLI